MSSGRTPNMGLHIWDENDYFDVDEFNENFNKLDAIDPSSDLRGLIEELTNRVNSMSESISNLNTSVGALNTKMDAIDDYVIENGSQGDWTWTKWNSGKIDIWIDMELSGTISWTRSESLDEILYESDEVNINSTPSSMNVPMSNIKIVSAHFPNASSSHLWIVTTYSVATPYNLRFKLLSDTNRVNLIDGRIRIYGTGRWK